MVVGLDAQWMGNGKYVFFVQAEDGIRDLVRSRGLGDVYKRQDLHRFGRQPGGLEAFLDQRGDGAVGADRFRTAAQDGGVAGFQAQGGGIGGDVRARFVNDADDAERYACLL